MMIKKYILACVLGMFLLPSSGWAQDCYYTEKFCPHAKREGFVYNLQSQSGAFLQGDTAEISFIAYKNMEYRISICCPSNYELDGQFQFQVIEYSVRAEWKETKDAEGNIVKRRVFTKIPVIRYDNAAGSGEGEAPVPEGKKGKGETGNPTDFVFHSDRTRKLYVKVYVPVLEGENGQDLGADSYACVGLLIEHKPGTVTGFHK